MKVGETWQLKKDYQRKVKIVQIRDVNTDKYVRYFVIDAGSKKTTQKTGDDTGHDYETTRGGFVYAYEKDYETTLRENK